MIHPQNESTRQRQLSRLRDRPRSRVLIIGGGINGIATFRELALHGVEVTLVERGDFASGASSASSHMVHGGLRYLENGEFRLVRESVQERNRLLRNAPHSVVPLATTIPIERVFAGVLAAPLRFLTHRQRTPKARGALLIKAGLVIYDLFAGRGAVVPKHRFQGRRRLRKRHPELDERFRCAATYFDAAMQNPERLALDVLGDGLAAGEHALAVNYLEATGADADGAVLLRDRISGERLRIQADLVVNATGPWADLSNAALGVGSAFMGGTKGAHIVVDNPDLLAACGGDEIFFEHRDGRIVLIYPLAGRVLIGTTDERFDLAQAEPVCTEEDIDYFIALIAQVFPAIPVTRQQIVFSFAGVRPLPRAEDSAPGFISRDYRVESTGLGSAAQIPLLTLVGGKWTTFRALGEQLADQVLALIGLTRSVDTTALVIGGGRGYPADAAARSAWLLEHAAGLDQTRAELLLHRYGTRARVLYDRLRAAGESAVAESAVAESASGGSAAEQADAGSGTGQRPGDAPMLLSAAEIEYLVEQEQAVTLADVFYRRTELAFRGLLSRELIERTSRTMAAALGWDEGRRKAQLAQLEAQLGRSRARIAQSAALA